MKLFELFAELTLDTTGFAAGIKNSSKQGVTFANTIKNSLSATTVMMGNLMSSAVQKGIGYVKEFAGIGLEYNSTMETYVTNFTTMLNGSSEAAQKLTGDLEDMAAATPFAMSDLAGATQTLLSFGQDSGTVLDTLQSLGDIAMGDAQKLSSLTLAFAQASSSGKLMGQDLMQMINAGFNPLQTIVDQTGASMGDLKDFMSNGKASNDLKKQMQAAKKEVSQLGDAASDGAKMLAQMAEDGAISAETLGMIFDLETSPGGRYYNAMQNASETFSGMLSTLQDDASALLGRVFKPMSDYIKSDLMPKAQGFINNVNKGFDVGGIKGAWSAAVGTIRGYLSELGGVALDAGSTLLADVLSGLTGGDVKGEDVKAFFTDIWEDVNGTISSVVSAGSGLLNGIYTGLTGDSANRGNIVTFFSGLLTELSGMASETASAIGGMLGSVYTAITGKEATAKNIGGSMGGAMSAVAQVPGALLKGVSTFASGFTAVMVEGTQGGEKTDAFAENVQAFSDAIVGGVEAAAAALPMREGAAFTEIVHGIGEEFAQEFEKGREEAEARTGRPVDESGQTRAATVMWGADHQYHADPGILAEWEAAQEKNATVLKSQTELMQMISNMWGANADFGVSESQLDAWMTIIRQGKKDTEYVSAAKAIMEAYGGDEGGGGGSPEDLASAVQTLTAAAEGLAAAAAAAAVGGLAGAKVEMDGQTVGTLVLPTVAAGLARQYRQAAVATP